MLLHIVYKELTFLNTDAEPLTIHIPARDRDL